MAGAMRAQASRPEMQRATAIPIVPARATAPGPMLTCHGCKHCLYAARYGQAGEWPGRPAILSQPHSRCSALNSYVPMVMGEQDKWLGSVVPEGCPEHLQPGLFP
jgi:hypothetical protein